jgi:hypothetical protein
MREFRSLGSTPGAEMIVLCRIIRPSGEQYDDILELALRRLGGDGVVGGG